VAVSLPKGIEGGQKREYPWGDKFDENKCNTRESGIKGTTPVGRYFPDGDSPYGCADMAGNVWEVYASRGLQIMLSAPVSGAAHARQCLTQDATGDGGCEQCGRGQA